MGDVYGGLQDVAVEGFTITSEEEELRAPRKVRVGAIQNKIILDTREPVALQREALHKRIIDIVGIAGRAGVNVLGLQEAWRKLNKIPPIPILQN